MHHERQARVELVFRTNSLSDDREGEEGAPRTLVVEAIDAVDRGALVVAAQKEEVLRVP